MLLKTIIIVIKVTTSSQNSLCKRTSPKQAIFNKIRSFLTIRFGLKTSKYFLNQELQFLSFSCKKRIHLISCSDCRSFNFEYSRSKNCENTFFLQTEERGSNCNEKNMNVSYFTALFYSFRLKWPFSVAFSRLR